MSVKVLDPFTAESWRSSDLELCDINRISHALVGETAASSAIWRFGPNPNVKSVYIECAMVIHCWTFHCVLEPSLIRRWEPDRASGTEVKCKTSNRNDRWRVCVWMKEREVIILWIMQRLWLAYWAKQLCIILCIPLALSLNFFLVMFWKTLEKEKCVSV